MTNSLQARIDMLNEDNKEQEQLVEIEKQLITIEPSHSLDIFTDNSKVIDLINSIRGKIKAIVPDVYSEKGRKEIASMAYSVARTKTYLDSIGKDLVDQYKEIPKKIDSNRKFARDALDSLRDEVRNPLTLWEDEQEARRLQEKIFYDHQEALVMNDEFNRRKAEQLELERLREEEKIRLLKEQAQREADERAKRELERQKLQHERELQQAKIEMERQKSEQERKLAEVEKRKLMEIEAEKKRSAEQARIILEKQKNDELRRLLNEEMARVAEQIRINDEIHIKKIRKEIIYDMTKNTNFSEDSANALLCLIENGHIRHLSIQY